MDSIKKWLSVLMDNYKVQYVCTPPTPHPHTCRMYPTHSTPSHTLLPSHAHTGPPVQRAAGHCGGPHPHGENVASVGLVRKRRVPESRQNGLFDRPSNGTIFIVCISIRCLLLSVVRTVTEESFMKDTWGVCYYTEAGFVGGVNCYTLLDDSMGYGSLEVALNSY